MRSYYEINCDDESRSGLLCQLFKIDIVRFVTMKMKGTPFANATIHYEVNESDLHFLLVLSGNWSNNPHIKTLLFYSLRLKKILLAKDVSKERAGQLFDIFFLL